MSAAANKKGAGPAGSLKLRRTARGINLRATGQLAQRMLIALQGCIKEAEGEPYTTVQFRDDGQDFLEWDLDAEGVVVDSRPFQRDQWRGTRVLNTPKPGCRLDIVTPRARNPRQKASVLNHFVAAVVEGVRK